MSAATGVGARSGAGRLSRLRVTALLLAAALTGCANENGAAPAQRLSPPEFDEGVVHVHGLGVDPGTGTLYAATHTGLFRITAQGTGVRVANRAQDTMGFTVVGAGRFLGSGHPDFREDPDLRPPLLGLIESTDAGETWQRRSLRGSADFHVLRYRHQRIYGYDSTGGRLMISQDGQDWQTRSAIGLRDFDVSPNDAEALLATTERGLLRSRDGGRTWQHLPAPALSEIAWAQDGTLYGTTLTGQVLVSEDDGEAWTLRSRDIGVAEALLTGPGPRDLYVAVADRGIVHSTDAGMTFSDVYRSPRNP